MDVLVELDEYTAEVQVPEDAVDKVKAVTVSPGFQALANRTKFLSSFGTRLRNLAYTVPESTTGAKMSVDSATSTDWQDITDCSKTVATKPNDRVFVLVMCDTDLGNPGTHSLDLSHEQASATEAEFSGSIRLVEGDQRKGHTLIGMWQATHDENVTVKLRGKAASGDFSVYGGIVMIVAVVAQSGVWP